MTGREIDPVIQRFDLATRRFAGLASEQVAVRERLVTIDPQTGEALSIERVIEPARADAVLLALIEFAFQQLSNDVYGLCASEPGLDTSRLPGPPANIISPLMLLPLMRSPSFSTKISALNWLATLTNIAAGRA